MLFVVSTESEVRRRKLGVCSKICNYVEGILKPWKSYNMKASCLQYSLSL